MVEDYDFNEDVTELFLVPPEKRMAVLSVRMPGDVFRRFAQMAEAHGMKVSDAARRAIEMYAFDDPDTAVSGHPAYWRRLS